MTNHTHSNIRQVPDNQEVYLARNALGSIVVEITERVQPPDHPCTTDEEALQYHYQDLIAAGYGRNKPEDEVEEETKIWRQLQTTVGNLGINVPAYTLFATQKPKSPPVGDQTGGKPQPDFVAILFTMIRLVKQKSDILISINVPHTPGEYDPSEIDFEAGNEGPLLDAADDYMDQLLMSFKIEDWSLFVTE